MPGGIPGGGPAKPGGRPAAETPGGGPAPGGAPGACGGGPPRPDMPVEIWKGISKTALLRWRLKGKYLLGKSWPCQSPYPVGDAHPPDLHAQINDIISTISVVLIGDVQGSQLSRLKVPLLGKLVLDIIRQNTSVTASSRSLLGLAGPRNVTFQLALQGANFLLHLGQADLTGLVEGGAEIETVAAEPHAVCARLRLVTLELAAAAFEARGDEAHAATDGPGRG